MLGQLVILIYRLEMVTFLPEWAQKHSLSPKKWSIRTPVHREPARTPLAGSETVSLYRNKNGTNFMAENRLKKGSFHQPSIQPSQMRSLPGWKRLPAPGIGIQPRSSGVENGPHVGHGAASGATR